MVGSICGPVSRDHVGRVFDALFGVGHALHSAPLVPLRIADVFRASLRSHLREPACGVRGKCGAVFADGHASGGVNVGAGVAGARS